MFGSLPPGSVERAGRACPRRAARVTGDRCWRSAASTSHDPHTAVRGISFSVAAGRDPRHRRHRRQRPEAARRGAGRPAARCRRARSCSTARPIQRLDVGARRRLGLRYVTDDRLGEGTVASFPGLDQLPAEADRRAAVLAARHRAAAARSPRTRAGSSHDYDVRTPGVETPIGRLSGGNIQKALLARELSGAGQGGDLQQADLRPRRAEHRSRPAAASAKPPTPASPPS